MWTPPQSRGLGRSAGISRFPFSPSGPRQLRLDTPHRRLSPKIYKSLVQAGSRPDFWGATFSQVGGTPRKPSPGKILAEEAVVEKLAVRIRFFE